MNIFNYLKRPEYIFRPRQVLLRIGRVGKNTPSTAEIILPWGAPIKVRPDENVGGEIYYYGIFDRIVPETIYRLADAGELAVEAGANIGQNCSLLSHKVGSAGQVIAFEPHPEIFAELKANATLWPQKTKQNLQLENVALGEANGEAWLADGSDFRFNRGSASLSTVDPEASSGRKYRVALCRLDEYLPALKTVGVCKIDVEGHELSVLKGAEQALSRRAIRDIVFEDFSPMPSPVAGLLQKYGFSLFQLITTWWKPVLAEILPGTPPARDFSYNYLATLDPERAIKRFRVPGWRCLLNS